MKRRLNAQGFTLVEVILATVVIGAAFMGMVYVLASTTMGNRTIDCTSTATLLARETMEQMTAKDFGSAALAIGTTGPTSYGGNFARYSYQVDVGYVAAADLNTVVGGATDYKRIVVTVTRTGWTGAIRLTSIKSNT